jgi:hypothetical protein
VSFLALTTHFIVRENGRLVLRNRLLAFRIVEGSHSGENLARIIFAIIKDAGLLGKVRLTCLYVNMANSCCSSENLHSTMLAITVLLWSGLSGYFVKRAYPSVALEIVSSENIFPVYFTGSSAPFLIQLLPSRCQYCGANYTQGT